MPNFQEDPVYDTHIQAVNTYNISHSRVFENVCINEFYNIPVDIDTNEPIGIDISTYDILKGNSTCSHLPKYIVVVADTMDHNMLSIHTSYDHCMDVSFDNNNYVIYERITDCLVCCYN
jgi:hypothetical protein